MNTPRWLFSSLFPSLFSSLFWAGPCMFQGCQPTAREAEFLLEKKTVYGKIMEAQPGSPPPHRPTPTHTLQVCPPEELFQQPALLLVLRSLCSLESHLDCQEPNRRRAEGGAGVLGGPCGSSPGVSPSHRLTPSRTTGMGFHDSLWARTQRSGPIVPSPGHSSPSSVCSDAHSPQPRSGCLSVSLTQHISDLEPGLQPAKVRC